MARTRPTILMTVVIGALLGGCTSSPPGEQPEPVDLADPFGDQLAWAIDAFNEPVDPAAYAARHDDDFRRAVPLAAFEGPFLDLALRQQGPWQLVRFIEGPSATNGVALIRSSHGELWSLTLSIEADPPHLVTSQWIAPHADLSEEPTEGPLPPTVLGDQLGWVLDVLNAQPTPEQYRDHLAASFHAAISFEDFEAILADIRATGPFLFERTTESKEFEAKAWVFNPAGVRTTVSMAIDPEPPHAITSLLLEPTALEDPPTTSGAFVQRVAELAPDSTVLVAEITADGCESLAEHDPDRPLAIGSTFKLAVLEAVRAAVTDGTITWDDEVAINEEFKSLPSGSLQNEPQGTTFTVREMAERMIQVSDNTATDHLLHLVGRDAVETAQITLGMREPERNRPFLTTREAFQLKWQVSDDQRQRFIAADEDTRRGILDSLAAEPLTIDAAALDLRTPADIEHLEWFASAKDVCQMMVSLVDPHDSGTGGGEVARILQGNPGLRLDEQTWGNTGFKGGSEPGVLSLPLVSQRDDGTWFFVGAILNASDEQPSTWGDVPLLVASAFQILAEAP